MYAKTSGLVKALMITTLFTSGAAYAASSPTQPAATTSSQSAVSSDQQSVDKDFSKLSTEGALAYHDVNLARLAIYDGKVDQAKKLVDEAASSFDKAKTDETVFTKAEADLKPVKTQNNAQQGSSENATPPDQMNKPIAWLPVDATVTINEDYTLNPAKTKAVAEANQKLNGGDKKAAMETLKLANIDTDVVLAVVPVQKTMDDVHQAAQLIDSGKYYEGSQMLRQVQMATRFDIADINSAPNKTTGDTTSPSQHRSSSASSMAPAQSPTK